MSLSAKDRKELQFRRLLESSPSALKIVADRTLIEERLRALPRRVWPLATVARLFGASPSLLRKWMGRGLLAPFKQPSKSYRSGITVRGIQAFLRQLCEQAERGIRFRRRRRYPAGEKCLKAFRELGRDEILSPAEFAARARVGVTTVHRLLAAGWLDGWYPSPHRPKICGSRKPFSKNI